MSAVREIILVALGGGIGAGLRGAIDLFAARFRSEEHTSELQSH